jgi:hypothetical protein
MKQIFTLFFLFAILAGLSFAQDAADINLKPPVKTFIPEGQNIPTPYESEFALLHDNGPLITHPTGGLGGNPASAVQTALLMSLYGFGAQLSAGNSMADDFTVTGAGWNIDEMQFFTYQTNSGTTSTINDLRVQIYNGPPNAGGTVVWGDMTTNRLSSTNWTTIYRVLDTDLLSGARPIMRAVAQLTTPINLAAGTYWVEFQFGGTGASGPWAPPVTVLGSTGNGNALQKTSTGWAAAMDAGSGTQQDMPFIIMGTEVPSGYAFPELIYYIFDENTGTTTANYAVPGAGNNPASLTGTTTWATPGQFGSAIIGDGIANGGVVTGWNCNLGSGSWTISMWLEIPTNSSGSAYYLFGDPGSTSFRCFHNGVALPDNLVLRGGGLTDVFVNGIGPAPTVVHLVYDATVPEVRTYKNGVLNSTAPQAALNMPTGSGFKVGGYSSSAIMIGKMDEFRLYNRALDAAEVAATWNISIVPVELTSFTASVNGNNVKLLWETASELNNSGFSIERKYSNTEFMEVGFVPGFGTTTEPKSYSFTDNNLRSGVYSYRLKQIDFDGTFTYSDEVEVEVIAPASFSLDQNYPNPFNPTTRISFSLAVDSKVSLKIFDVLGQEVASLVNQDLTQGVHTYDFNATGINSGVYFYKLEATGLNGNEFTDVKKMILVK